MTKQPVFRDLAETEVVIIFSLNMKVRNVGNIFDRFAWWIIEW